MNLQIFLNQYNPENHKQAQDSVKITHMQSDRSSLIIPYPGLWTLLLAALIFFLCALPVAAAVTPESRPDGTAPTPENLRGCGGARFASSDAAFEEEVVRLINVIRQGNGLLPLKRVEDLDAAARFHAADMSEESYFSHTSHDRVDGALVESCKWSDRLRTYYTNWNLIAENIAAGFSSPQAAVDGWMNSPGHRNNILSPNNWETGVGYFNGNGSYRRYWVQDFGRRNNVFPVIINGEAPNTDDGNLTIHIYGEWEEVRLRVDENQWSDWQPFAPSIQWELKAAAGVHTVQVEMRSATAGATASDSINLTQDTLEPALNSLPDALTFTYDPNAGAVTPGFHTIQPLAAVYQSGYSWQIAVDAAWLSASPGAGSGTEVVALVPSVSGAGEGDAEEATVTVSLLAEDGTVVAEERIVVSIRPAADSYSVFVPVVKTK